MAMAAAAALLRSMATKMARAPPRLPYALAPHGRRPTSTGGLWPSRFSTSTGSKPPLANLKGAQTPNKKVPNGWDREKTGFGEDLTKAAYFMVFGNIAFMYFYVIPALDRIQESMDATSVERLTIIEEIKQRHERAHASQIEARDVASGDGNAL